MIWYKCVGYYTINAITGGCYKIKIKNSYSIKDSFNGLYDSERKNGYGDMVIMSVKMYEC